MGFTPPQVRSRPVWRSFYLCESDHAKCRVIYVFNSKYWGEKNWNRIDIKFFLKNRTELKINVVITTELSPPPRWLATTEPTPPLRCFTVCSAVFLGAVYWKLPLTSSSIIWSLRECEHTARSVGGDTARPPPHVCFPTCKRQDCWDSSDSVGTVCSENVTTVSLSAPSTSRAVSN